MHLCRLGINNVCKGGMGGESGIPQLAENWFLYSSNIAWTLLVTLWRKYINLPGHVHKLATLLLTGFMSLMHFVMYSIITQSMTVGPYS